MKRIITKKFAFFGLGVLLFLGACDGYIEEDIFSDLTAESFIDASNADQLVVGVYGALRPLYKDYAFQFLGTDVFTVQAELFVFNQTNDYFGFDSGQGGGIWSTNYNVIAKANTAINRYENEIDFGTAAQGDKAYGIAQAKALRALAFFNVVQQYGGVVLELEEPTTIRSDYARSSEQETYTQIISDLEVAIPDLIDDSETGRFSKRAAQHLLAEVYLTRGYSDFGDSLDFTTAAALAEQAIGTYDIREQTFAQIFDFSNQVNPEVLFAVQWGSTGEPGDQDNNKHSLFQNQVQNYDGIGRANPYGVDGSGMMPTPYFYSLFSDDDSREEATLHRVLFASEEATVVSEFGTDNVAVGDTVIYYPKVALDAVELADKLNRYYVYQPDQYLFGVPENVPGAVYQYGSNINRLNFPIFKKFDDVDFESDERGQRDTFVFRVAGSHLLAGEAHLGAGNLGQALFHINRVRERATGLPNFYTALTIDDILDERALELAGESNRWAVLKRTGKLQEHIELYNPHVIDHGAFDASIHLLRPIPSGELQLSNGSLLQNPGY